jgi:hypothetical protein
MSINQSLPKFNRPPVVETVLGVEFAQLIRWGIPHFGLYWATIRNEYQHCPVREPLLSRIETFGEEGKHEITFGFPQSRWFIRCHPDLRSSQEDDHHSRYKAPFAGQQSA